MKKDRMFQYAHKGYVNKIIEDTGLITEEEANELWDKYLPDFVEKLKDGYRPGMCIWKDCETTTSYHTVEKEVDSDCIIENGRIYKKVEVI